VNLKNNKFYVGRSHNIDKRFKRHKNDLKNGNHHCAYLQRSWNKNNGENFIFDIIEECNLERSLELEQYYLDNFKNEIYNTSFFSAYGGDLISNNPNKKEIIVKREATKRITLDKMSIEERNEKFGRKGENGMYGKTHTKEIIVINKA
jgi:group I intron endonuclease